MCFLIIIGRLEDHSYTQQEVLEEINTIQDLCKIDVNRELSNLIHMNILLLQQYFSQAQEADILLKSNIAQLENK